MVISTSYLKWVALEGRMVQLTRNESYDYSELIQATTFNHCRKSDKRVKLIRRSGLSYETLTGDDKLLKETRGPLALN